MAGDEAFHNRLADWRGVIHVTRSEKSRARIKFTRLEVAIRQLDEGMMLPDGDRLRRRNDLPDPAPGVIAHERECRFNFRVLGEVLCSGQVECGAGAVELERA